MCVCCVCVRVCCVCVLCVCVYVCMCVRARDLKQIHWLFMQAEEELCTDIINLCKAVIHLESIHNRTTIRTAYDKDLINLLNKGAEVQAQLQHCDWHLAKVSDIVPLIEVW